MDGWMDGCLINHLYDGSEIECPLSFIGSVG